MPCWKSAVVCLLTVSLCGAQARIVQSPRAEGLPVTRIVLYKNGVGYFEHAGHVHGNQDVNIDFTTDQLNDVLKSLTVLDLGKGRITGVSYNSTAPIEHSLGSLRLPVSQDPTIVEFLTALRGARVEAQNGSATAVGRVLSIDKREQPGRGEEKITSYQLSVVSDAGDVRVFDVSPSTRVKVLEKEVNDQVGKFLGLLASTRNQDVRRMTLSTAGEGDRGLLVSYISEVPVWKSTYRIIVPASGKPLLQGWAIVDNTVGEDWKNIELSLVAGAPQSFVQQLSQPYYIRRPEVPLPENAELTPQTHEATMESDEAPPPPAMVANGVAGGVPGGVMGGVAGSIVSGNGAGVGPGMLNGSLSSVPHFEADTAAKSLEATTTVAETTEVGDPFQYKLKDRVTIRKNQSALVPILQTRIDAEEVSVWTPSQISALRALWLDNTSNLTLDGGTFNVLEGDAFAGEGIMEAIKPGEKRILSYAADLGILVDAKEKPQSQRVTKVLIAHGVMTQMTEERSERTYTVHNRDTSPRTLLIEHPARTEWKLTKDEVPVESSTSYHRFRLTVEPTKTASLVIKEYRPISTRYQISSVNDDHIKYFLDQKMISPEVEQSLRKIIAQKNEIANLGVEAASRKTQIISISENQQRVRENMKALKGSAEEKTLTERYARELNEEEDRVQSLQKEIADLQGKRANAQRTLNEMIEGLQMETTL
jgi:hypothetical protein